MAGTPSIRWIDKAEKYMRGATGGDVTKKRAVISAVAAPSGGGVRWN